VGTASARYLRTVALPPASEKLGVTGPRVVLVGACLIVGPLLNLLGDLFAPPLGQSAATHFEAVASHLDRQVASVSLWLAALILEGPAVLGLAAIAGGRSVPQSRYGRGMALTGLGAFVVLTLYEVKLASMASSPGPGDAAAVERVVSGGSYLAVLFLSQLWFFGLIALAIAVRRAETGPRAAPVLILAGAALGLVALYLLPSRPTGIAASAMLAAGLGLVGVDLLRGHLRPASGRS